MWETQSRWCCVMQRRQKSSTCSLLNTQHPACTGWRCKMTAGGSFYIKRSIFFLYWWLGFIHLVDFFLSSTLSSFSESEDESSRFLPKLPSLPKRWDSELWFVCQTTEWEVLGSLFSFYICNCFYCFSIFLCAVFVFSYSTTSKIFR